MVSLVLSRSPRDQSRPSDDAESVPRNRTFEMPRSHQDKRPLRSHDLLFGELTRRPTFVFLSLLVILLPAVLPLACSPENEKAGIENVLLISIDALRARNSGAYGYDRDTTPNLDLLASEGTLFERAYTQQAWTLSSHISIFTGVYPGVHRASKSRPPLPAIKTLAQILKRNGFTTGAFTGIGGLMEPKFGLERGFDHYETGVNDAQKDNAPRFEWLQDQAWARKTYPDHRFFMFSHYYDVHSDLGTDTPYHSPPPFGLMYLNGKLDWKYRGDTALLSWFQKTRNVSPYDQDILRALYDGCIRYVDEKGLGLLLEKLKALGLYESTLIIVLSDHGEEFFEHGAMTHQQTYEETTRVPLILRGPGVPKGLRIPYLVELVDVAPTVLSLLSIPIPEYVQGESLVPLFDGARPKKIAAHIDGSVEIWVAKSRVVLEKDGEYWSYLNTVVPTYGGADSIPFKTDEPGELYRLATDPDEKSNLIDERPQIARSARKELIRWYSENQSLSRQLEKMGSAGIRSQEEKEELEEILKELHYIR